MIPLIYILIGYAVFALFGGLFLLFNMYHIAHFGLQAVPTIVILVAYFAVFVFVIGISLIALSTFNWTAEIPFSAIYEARDTGMFFGL
jgi:hypothetical protein